jgi:Beta-galactosidase
MYNSFLASPKLMNMGFHYTAQFSRRTRVNVMGLVDHSTPEWEEWYKKTHEYEALQQMADASYELIEIHFLYGFGLKSERKEVELTRKMTANAHRAGLKVVGYLQFFSVQQELFFRENPWAEKCLQLKADGTRHQYDYDRPALCFSHEKVRQYYLDGIKLGLEYCNLDGIRLDNDYYRGCYCEKCRELFRQYLHSKFSPDEAERVFGLRDLRDIVMPPHQRGSDPAWLEMVRFRHQQRQQMMKLLKNKIRAIKPDGILGGNPAVTRRIEDTSRINVYLPDLGETHDLVCAENSLFPARHESTIRGQYLAYKYGQAANFSVFASHHLYRDGRIRWPETSEECALSLFEALAFGGHTPCTTWGIRKDGDKTLYQRPEFMRATFAMAEFLKQHRALFTEAKCAATVGIYTNRESQIADSEICFASLQGAVLSLLQGQIPFRLVPFDNAEPLKGLDLLIVPNVRLISDAQLKVLQAFADRGGKILMTGESGKFDEYFLTRKPIPEQAGFTFTLTTPEAIDLQHVKREGNYKNLPLPEKVDDFLAQVKALTSLQFTVTGGDFVCIELSRAKSGNLILYLLNYDNSNPANLKITFADLIKLSEIHSPREFGLDDAVLKDNKITISNLRTFAALEITEMIPQC